jgi:hypothetical protein
MKSIPLILLTAVLALAQNTLTGRRQANGAIAPRPPEPPASFDCAADGSVVNSMTGEPIARAHVNVNYAGTTYSTATDISGKWALSNVGCAPAQLVVTRPAFLQRPEAIRGLTLTSGSPLHDLKTALIPQSVAWGKVMDDQGDPFMGAQVTVLASRVMEGRARFQQAGSGMTNDLGEYRIANLPRGKYILCVHVNQQNGQLQTAPQTIIADTCYPGPLEGGAASAMEVPAGHESKVDFTLNQVLPVHVRGTVSGLPEGRGIGINLIRRNINADFGGNLPGAVRDGKFDFRVPPGSYMLTADYFEAGKRLSARVPIDAGSSDIDNVAVHLDSGFIVTGIARVVSPSTQVAAIPRFQITLRPSEPVNGTGQLRWDTADPSSFAINDMVPGYFRLDATPPAPFYIKSATLAGQDILNSEIPISQAAGPLEIILGDDGGSLEGDVVDSDGKPVQCGIMLLRRAGRSANLMSQPNGHFRIQNLAPGDYTIYAWDEPNEVEYANSDWMRRYGGGGMPVTVTAGQSSQVKLTCISLYLI